MTSICALGLGFLILKKQKNFDIYICKHNLQLSNVVKESFPNIHEDFLEHSGFLSYKKKRGHLLIS